jgi:hypothetical protein
MNYVTAMVGPAWSGLALWCVAGSVFVLGAALCAEFLFMMFGSKAARKKR